MYSWDVMPVTKRWFDSQEWNGEEEFWKLKRGGGKVREGKILVASG